jgi:hypothetical protein
MKLITTIALLCITSQVFAGNSGMAMSTKDLNDDIRATIAKEMAIIQQFDTKTGNASVKWTLDLSILHARAPEKLQRL